MAMVFLQQQDPAPVQGRYAEMARRHLQEYLPTAFHRLKTEGRLEAYLADVQARTMRALTARAEEIRSTIPLQDPASYLERLRRETTAWSQAEEEILPTTVFLTPEEDLTAESFPEEAFAAKDPDRKAARLTRSRKY